MSESKLNKPLIRKMIKRFEREPKTYDQGTLGKKWDSRDYEYSSTLPRPKPVCGTVACLAGQAIICSEPSIDRAMRIINRKSQIPYGVAKEAGKRMGLSLEIAGLAGLFDATSNGWPKPFAAQWEDAKTYKGQTRAAINLLRAILETNGKILE